MFEFAHPWFFLLLPLPWLLRYGLPTANVDDQSALKVPFYQTIAQLYQQNTPRQHTRHLYSFIAYCIWFALVAALAAPQWLGKPLELPRSGRDIMLAVDISGSMQIRDLFLHDKKVDRLTVVKDIAGKFIQQRKGDRLGLILFGTNAYLQTPLTFDRKTVEQQLDDATVGLAGQETAIGNAIGLGIKHLKESTSDDRVLILLTDGVNNTGTISPIKAAELAKQLNIRVYTIGIGSDGLVPGIFGPRRMNPTVRLDTKSLTKIAQLTGGQFFRAKDTQALAQAYRSLDQLEPVESDSSVYRPITPLYPWPLSLALLLSFFLAAKKITWRSTREQRT